MELVFLIRPKKISLYIVQPILVPISMVTWLIGKKTIGQVFLLSGSCILELKKSNNGNIINMWNNIYCSLFNNLSSTMVVLTTSWTKIYVDNIVELLVDSKSTIDFAKNPVSHGRSKHIDTKFHFLRDQVSKGRVKLKHYKTSVTSW